LRWTLREGLKDREVGCERGDLPRGSCGNTDRALRILGVLDAVGGCPSDGEQALKQRIGRLRRKHPPRQRRVTLKCIEKHVEVTLQANHGYVHIDGTKSAATSLFKKDALGWL